MSVHALTLHQQLTADFQLVTPDLAREWLGHNEGNRNLKNIKIETYARDIRAGRWGITGEGIKFDWNGRLIDGQNRLHAIVKADRPATLLVVRGLDPEVQKLLDTGAKRSVGDALSMSGHRVDPHATGATIRYLIAWELGQLKTAHSKAPEVTHSETLAFYEANAEAVNFAVANGRRVAKVVGTPSTMAAAIFLTSQVDPEESLKFFRELAELDLGGVGNPKTTLYKRLQSLREEKHAPTQWLFFTLRAWNAWRAGESLSILRDRTSAGPQRMPEVQ